MKTIILTAAMLATSAHATDYDRYCTGHGKLSETIMRSRQAGVPLSDMLRIAKDDTLIRTLVMMAYNKPRMSAPENRATMIEDFRAERELKCFEVVEKRKAEKTVESKE